MRKVDLSNARCVITVATVELLIVGGGLFLARSTDNPWIAFGCSVGAYLLANLAVAVGKDIRHRRELANVLCDPT